MPTLHRLKFSEKVLCDAVYSGVKKYEVRYNDRDFKKGDIVFPVPVNELGELVEHPLIDNIYAVDFVSAGITGIQPDYCVFSIREVGESDIPKDAKFDACFDYERYHFFGTDTTLGKYCRDMRFSNNQLEVIRYGVEIGIDPALYAKPSMSVKEMMQKYVELSKLG